MRQELSPLAREGTLVGGKCIVTPEVVTSACEKGSLIDGKCVVTPDLVTAKCEQGTFVGDECVEVKIPPATEPVNLDDGMKRVDWKGSHAEITTTEAASALRNYQLTTTQNQRKGERANNSNLLSTRTPRRSALAAWFLRRPWRWLGKSGPVLLDSQWQPSHFLDRLIKNLTFHENLPLFS